MVALAPSWQREHVAEKFEVLHDRKEEERGGETFTPKDPANRFFQQGPAS